MNRKREVGRYTYSAIGTWPILCDVLVVSVVGVARVAAYNM